MDILAAAGSDAIVFTGKDICSRKKKAEKQRIHTFIIRLLMQRRSL